MVLQLQFVWASNIATEAIVTATENGVALHLQFEIS